MEEAVQRRSRTGDLSLLRKRPHGLWAPPTLLFKGLRGFSGVKRPLLALTTDVHLVPMLRRVELYFFSPIYLHDLFRNNLTVLRRRGTSFYPTKSVEEFPEGPS
jgi:hypothetical protein